MVTFPCYLFVVDFDEYAYHYSTEFCTPYGQYPSGSEDIPALAENTTL